MGENSIGMTDNPREVVLIEDGYGEVEINDTSIVREFPESYVFVGSYVFCGDHIHKFRYVGGPE